MTFFASISDVTLGAVGNTGAIEADKDTGDVFTWSVDGDQLCMLWTTGLTDSQYWMKDTTSDVFVTITGTVNASAAEGAVSVLGIVPVARETYPGSGVTNTTTMTPGATVTLSATSASVYVLVLPGTYSQAPTLAINLNEGGTSAIAVPPASLTTTTFAAGSKYTYAVSIARTAITISNPTITDWTNVNGSAINPGL